MFHCDSQESIGNYFHWALFEMDLEKEWKNKIMGGKNGPTMLLDYYSWIDMWVTDIKCYQGFFGILEYSRLTRMDYIWKNKEFETLFSILNQSPF